MAVGFEFAAEFAEIVNFAVVNHREGASFVPYRLATSGQIHNTEASHACDNGRRDKNSFFIRPAMDHGSHHPADDRLAGLFRLDSDSSADSTHGLPRPCLSAMGNAPSASEKLKNYIAKTVSLG